MAQSQPVDVRRVAAALGSRSVVLVGMMGAGKTSVGKRLAARLGLPFVDADAEIEAGAQLTISEIFERFGEAYFREGERRVIARLLNGGPQVLATGGGAFMNAATRDAIAAGGVSIWLKPEVEVLLARVRKKANRPLLQTDDQEGALRRILADRAPIYALADITIESRDGPHESVVDQTLRRLAETLGGAPEAGPEAARRRVEVPLGSRAYSIHIGPGALDTAGAEIARIAKGAKCAIVTDANVAALYLDRVRLSLEGAGLAAAAIVCPPGESTKSYAEFARVCDALIAARIERRDIVVALGGGVIGDLAGFCAASLRRGVRFVQIPTTLLSQVDSSVGGKTGINSPHGKNLVGAFHQPSLVLADSGVLDTLSPREFRAGYAEVVKYGLIGDRGFFDFLEARWREVFSGGPARAEAIAASCAAKARVVVADETEQGERALLNLGHTFGHAFESLSHYDSARLVHGEGVAVGMACAFRFSRALGLCSGQDAVRVEAHLASVGLPSRIRHIPGLDADAGAILAAMRQDKKVERGRLTFVLARGIGESFLARDVDEAGVLAFLEQELALAPD
ncbi:3-dehydroquinate synthase [Roseiarcus fermentans]|uniref:Multifunctional fusion protein n=1 Tax=Roseiarcus fermentans TaxID=1473586 RepID=A0A366FVT3_9HYPH|nr:3-dehydroquinate synthase [Roseiarcus fermentans]RBP18256.1 3-dehydroquinate synthase [Roseiarcus fermentans]